MRFIGVLCVVLLGTPGLVLGFLFEAFLIGWCAGRDAVQRMGDECARNLRKKGAA